VKRTDPADDGAKSGSSRKKLSRKSSAPLPPFSAVPHWVIEHPELDAGDIGMFAILARFADYDDHTCFPGLPLLVALSRFSLYGVRQRLTNLRSAGVITVQRRGRGHTNLYTLIFDQVEHQEVRPEQSSRDAPCTHANKTQFNKTQFNETKEKDLDDAQALHRGRAEELYRACARRWEDGSRVRESLDAFRSRIVNAIAEGLAQGKPEDYFSKGVQWSAEEYYGSDTIRPWVGLERAKEPGALCATRVEAIANDVRPDSFYFGDLDGGRHDAPTRPDPDFEDHDDDYEPF
jgi:hypothetical protein